VVTSTVFVDLEGGLARDSAILDFALVFGLFEFDIKRHGAILALWSDLHVRFGWHLDSRNAASSTGRDSFAQHPRRP